MSPSARTADQSAPMIDTGRRTPVARRTVGSTVVLLLGAALYAALEGVVRADFDLTPLVVGVFAIAAGLVGGRGRLVATGLVLAGWGAAVIAVDHGVVPAVRITPAYMLGVGAGLLIAGRLAPVAQRGEWLTSGAVAAFIGPLGLYLAYDLPAVGRWQAWVLALAVWASWELFWCWRRPLSDPAPA